MIFLDPFSLLIRPPNAFPLDIQEKNIMLGIEDPSILADFEEAEKSNPSPREIIEDRVIYLSHKLKKTNQHDRPVLCDFSQAPLDQPVTQVI